MQIATGFYKKSLYIVTKLDFIMKIVASILCFVLFFVQLQLAAQSPNTRFLCGYSKETILQTAKGQRPAVHDYLDTLYIRRHLAHFQDGASYLVPKDVLDKYGRDRLGRPDGQFVMAKAELDVLLAKVAGDLAVLEKELGIPTDAWKGRELVRIDIPLPRYLGLRMPCGNEGGANELWLPGGFLPTGYREAVIDPIEKGRYEETSVEIR